MNYFNVHDTKTQAPPEGPKLNAGIGSDAWKSGAAYIQHRCAHDFPQSVGRDNWTCEIPAKDVADQVDKHVNWWVDKNNKSELFDDRHEASRQAQFWCLWYDFLIAIEPNVKLKFTVDDYRFFYFGVGKARELSE